MAENVANLEDIKVEAGGSKTDNQVCYCLYLEIYYEKGKYYENISKSRHKNVTNLSRTENHVEGQKATSKKDQKSKKKNIEDLKQELHVVSYYYR